MQKKRTVPVATAGYDENISAAYVQMAADEAREAEAEEWVDTLISDVADEA